MSYQLSTISLRFQEINPWVTIGKLVFAKPGSGLPP